jgi:hypothetical protein
LASLEALSSFRRTACPGPGQPVFCISFVRSGTFGRFETFAIVL